MEYNWLSFFDAEGEIKSTHYYRDEKMVYTTFLILKLVVSRYEQT